MLVAGVLLLAVAMVAPTTRAGAGSDPSEARPADDDYAQLALNVLPSGQYGTVPPSAAATGQAQMYDGLTPLSGDVTDADLTEYFKSEHFGTDGQGPTRTEADTPEGVTVVRDAMNVPHITGTSATR